MRATHPLLYPLSGTVRAFSRQFGLLRPLLTSAPRSGDLTVTPVPWDTTQISWGKPRSFPRTPAGFTAAAFDGYGLRDWLPARPATPASLSGCCSSGREFAPHFLQTVPRGSALVLHSCFTSIRLHRGLSPPSCWACPAHSPPGGRKMRPSLTAAARDGRTIVRAGTEEWLRRGPNQRMARHRRATCRQIRSANPKLSPLHETGASPICSLGAPCWRAV